MPYYPPYAVRTSIDDLLPQVHRSPGWHLSDILNDYWVQQGRYEDRPFKLTERMKLGNLLEWAKIHRMRAAYSDRYFQLGDERGELTLDGIKGTPDQGDMRPWEDTKLVDVVTVDDRAVWECKLTWMKDPAEGVEGGMPDSPKYAPYWLQGTCYAHMASVGEGAPSGNWRVVRLAVEHVDGGYTWPRETTSYQFEKVLSRGEMLEAWVLVRSHQRQMIDAGRIPASVKEVSGG